MVHAAGRGKNYGASWCECQAYQPLAGDFEIGQTVGRNLHDHLASPVHMRMRSPVSYGVSLRVPDSDAATYRLPFTSKARPCGLPRPL